jgi:3-oxoacyl-[acyl-carrier protein] reductase
MDELHGKVALVTGGAKGLGAGIALGLAREGCGVAVNYRASAEAAEATRHAIEALGRRALAIRADLSRPEEVEHMTREIEAKLGPVAILVNNAGTIRPRKLDQVGLQDWEEALANNLTPAFLCTQAVVPGMRQRRWGRIVNISSLAAQQGGLVGPHYSAAKAGLLGLTHCYATLLAKEGITCNAVAPALIETDMVRGNPNARPDLIPVGRFGRVDEHTEAVLMLVRNGYITGQTINVNGGMYFS